LREQTAALIWMGAIVFVVVFVILPCSVKVLRPYQRGVVFRLGRLYGVLGPGLRSVWPLVDKMVLVDTRVRAEPVSVQDLMTRDRAVVTVGAVVYFYIADPEKAVVAVERSGEATVMFTKLTIGTVVSESELEEVMRERHKLNQRVRETVDQHAAPWGIKVTAVEIRDVTLKERPSVSA
jgi:regulator of protease activity HflC (stomatin/prohibitin superfamily)